MATFYADSAGAQGTGDGSSAANACTLVQAITNNAANVNSLHLGLNAGDTIYCKNGTTITFDGSAGVFATTVQAGTTTAPIRVVGYATTVTDGGVVVVNDSNAGATSLCFVLGVDYWTFENFKATNCRDAWSAGTTQGHIWINCEANGCVTEGFETGGGTGDSHLFVSCAAIGCGTGFSVGARAASFINCVAIGNTGIGFEVGNANYGATMINCVAHANGGDGIELTGECRAINCASNRNTGSGFKIADSDHPTALVNCGATSNAAYGIDGVANTKVHVINCGLNPTNEANTSGKNSANVTLYETGEVTGDPDFTDPNPAATADVDLSLSSSSAWKAAGAALGPVGFTGTATFTDLGPAQREEPAGVGNIIVIED